MTHQTQRTADHWEAVYNRNHPRRVRTRREIRRGRAAEMGR